MEPTSLEQQPMDYQQPSSTNTNNSLHGIVIGEDGQEDFNTVTLNDDHWLEDPVPYRHLCIHEH